VFRIDTLLKKAYIFTVQENILKDGLEKRETYQIKSIKKRLYSRLSVFCGTPVPRINPFSERNKADCVTYMSLKFNRLAPPIGNTQQS